MHAGFPALRAELPFDLHRPAQTGQVSPDAHARADIARIVELWTDCRTRHAKGGPFLFGRFSIADAMYAPVVMRFHSYGVPTEGAAATYADTVRNLAATREWVEGARRERVASEPA